jgi:hypothetical protein
MNIGAHVLMSTVRFNNKKRGAEIVAGKGGAEALIAVK